MIDKALVDPSEKFDPKEPRTQQRARMWASRKQGLAREIGNLMGGSPTAEDATPAKERDMWWQRDPKVDAQALYARGFPPEVVAAMEYPNRVPMMTAAGRKDDPKAQYEYVQRIVKLGPPEPVAPVPQPDGLSPDGLPLAPSPAAPPPLAAPLLPPAGPAAPLAAPQSAELLAADPLAAAMLAAPRLASPGGAVPMRGAVPLPPTLEAF